MKKILISLETKHVYCCVACLCCRIVSAMIRRKMSLSFFVMKLLINLRHKLHLVVIEHFERHHVTHESLIKQLGATGIVILTALSVVSLYIFILRLCQILYTTLLARNPDVKKTPSRSSQVFTDSIGAG